MEHPEECPHGLEYGCVACKKRAPQLPADSRPFKAQYDDWCRECRLDVMEGDTILYRETPEWAGVIHVDCA